jgi:hypothetical protein
VQFESLESRRLLSADTTYSGEPASAVTVTGGTLSVWVTDSGGASWQIVGGGGSVTRRGTLVVKGGDAADRITVIRDRNLIKYMVDNRVDAPVTTIIHASLVKRVLVEAGAGTTRSSSTTSWSSAAPSTAARATTTSRAVAVRR